MKLKLIKSSEPMGLNDYAIYGLIFDCPVGEQRPDCPLAGIRTMPITQRIEWASLLTSNDIKILLEKHSRCYTDNFSYNHKKNFDYERE